MGKALHIEWLLHPAMLAQVSVAFCIDPQPIDVSVTISTSEAVAYELATIA